MKRIRICLRFGLEDTLQEIRNKLKVTRECIRQLAGINVH